MPVFSWIIAIPLLVFVLMEAFPRSSLAVVAELKRRFRLWLIRSYGGKAADALIDEMRVKYGRQGYDTDDVERTAEEYRTDFVEKLGAQYANDLMGEPSIWERYY